MGMERERRTGRGEGRSEGEKKDREGRNACFLFSFFCISSVRSHSDMVIHEDGLAGQQIKGTNINKADRALSQI